MIALLFIFFALDAVAFAAPGEHGLSQKAVEIARPFGFPITNSMVVTWVVAVGLIVFAQSIFRFSQAGSEVSALLGRTASAVGYQQRLATRRVG